MGIYLRCNISGSFSISKRPVILLEEEFIRSDDTLSSPVLQKPFPRACTHCRSWIRFPALARGKGGKVAGESEIREGSREGERDPQEGKRNWMEALFLFLRMRRTTRKGV